MTREEALELIDGLTEEELIALRDVILAKIHNRESGANPLEEDQEAD